MKKLLLVLLFLTIGSKVFAALPPFAQSKKEIESILTSTELAYLIPSGEAIEEIRKTPGGYLIITREKIIPISVKYLPAQNIGPARYELIFHDPIELFAAP